MKRLLSLVVLVALLAVPALTAYAQDGEENPLCQGLSFPDCVLLTDSDAAMTDVTSFTTPDWELSLFFSLPNEDGTVETFDFSARGSTGGFDLSPGAEIVAHLVIDEASLTADNQTQTGSAEVIVTQDMAYILFDGEWYGDSLEEADLDVGQIAELGGAASMSDVDQLGIDLTNVVNTTRDADAEMMGQGMAVFVTNVDVGALLIAALSSPAVGGLLGEEMAGDGMEMSPEDVQMLGMFLTPMLAGTSLTSERWVGLNDNYIHMLGLDLVLSLDLSMLAPEIGKIEGEIHFASGLSNFNEPVSATVPESYRPGDELGEQLEGLEDLGSGLSGLGM